MALRCWRGLAAILPSRTAALRGSITIGQPGDDRILTGLTVADVLADFLRGPRKVQLELAQGLPVIRCKLDGLLTSQVLHGLAKRQTLLETLGPLLHPLLC